MKRALVSLLSLLSLSSFPAAASEATEARAEWARFLDEFPATKGKMTEGERIKSLYDRQWQWALREFPELSTALGVPGRNHLWSDQSLASMHARRALDRKILAAAESVDRSKLEEKDRIHYDLYVRQIRNGLEGQRFPGEYLVMDQMGGLQQNVPASLIQMPARTVKEFEDILSRLRGVPTLVDSTLERLEKGLAAGVTPPRITLRDLPGQVQNLITEDPMASALLKPFTAIPESIPAPDRDRLTREAVRIYQEQALPAFRKIGRASCRESVEISAVRGY